MIIQGAASRFPGKTQQKKRQGRPAEHKAETGLVSFPPVNANTVHNLPAPAEIEHPADQGLKHHGPRHDAHID